MQVGKAAGERTGLRRLNLDEVLRQGIGQLGLSEDRRAGAQAQRAQQKPPNPVPPCLCHCRRYSGRYWKKGQISKPVRSEGESGMGAKAIAFRRTQSVEKKFGSDSMPDLSP
ncbi:MAG: hypothetical protein WDM87_06210 [Terracidiphilus sp.]